MAYHPRGKRAHALAWRALEPFLPPGTQMTSAYRSAQDQLDIITARAVKAGYEFEKEPTVTDGTSWYAAWKVANRDPKNPIAQPGHSAHERRIAFDFVGPDLDAIKNGILIAQGAGIILLWPSRGGFSNPKVEGGCVHVEIREVYLYSWKWWKWHDSRSQSR